MDLSRRALLRGAGLLTLPWLASWPLPAAPSEPDALSVRDHGAQGDGKVKDTAAIQAAIDAAGPGGVVFFPVPQRRREYPDAVLPRACTADM